MVGQLVIGKDFRFFYHPPIGRIVTDMIELPTESQRPYAGQFVNLGSSYPTIHVPGYNIMFPQLRNTMLMVCFPSSKFKMWKMFMLRCSCLA